MPINYKEYHPKWSLIRRLILKRAKHKCEDCGVPNYSVVRKNTGTNEYESAGGSLYLDHIGKFGAKTYREAKQIVDHWNDWCPDGNGNWYVVVLTISHLDHNKDNNRFNNLKSRCQRCHINYDRTLHSRNRKYGRKHRKQQLKLFSNGR